MHGLAELGTLAFRHGPQFGPWRLHVDDPLAAAALDAHRQQSGRAFLQ
jgi:hypothetical protein